MPGWGYMRAVAAMDAGRGSCAQGEVDAAHGAARGLTMLVWCIALMAGRPFWYLSYVYVRMPAGFKGRRLGFGGKRNGSLTVFISK